MKIIGNIFTSLTAILHIGFLAMEMFFWQSPAVKKIFGTSSEFARDSAFMASNQGLYNGFLAAGLIWGIISGKRDVTSFFLICVVIAGIFGAITIKPSVFFVQAAPALLGLLCLYFAKSETI